MTQKEIGVKWFCLVTQMNKKCFDWDMCIKTF